jgi:hypothetical protein
LIETEVAFDVVHVRVTAPAFAIEDGFAVNASHTGKSTPAGTTVTVTSQSTDPTLFDAVNPNVEVSSSAMSTDPERGRSPKLSSAVSAFVVVQVSVVVSPSLIVEGFAVRVQLGAT